MLACHPFAELISHGILQEQQAKCETALILPYSPPKCPWAQPGMVRRDLGKTHIMDHTNG